MFEIVTHSKSSLKLSLNNFLKYTSPELDQLDIVIWRPVYSKESLNSIYTNMTHKGFDMPFDSGLAGNVFRTGIEIHSKISHDTPAEHKQIIIQRGWRYCKIFLIKSDNTKVGVCGIYSKEEININALIFEDFVTTARSSLLFCDVAINAYSRDQSLEKSLLSLEIGKVAEDRFHDIKETLFGAMGPLRAIKLGKYTISNAKLIEGQILKANEYCAKYIKEAKNPDFLDIQKVNLCKLVRSAANDFKDRNKHRKISRQKKIEIYFSVPDHDVFVNGDDSRLYRAINNVIYNAEYWVVRSYADKTRVDIDLSITEDGEASLKIRDTGPGIADLSRVREKGYSMRGGSGLGLAIASKIMKLHGGNLSIGSEVLSWTAVTLTLPVTNK